MNLSFIHPLHYYITTKLTVHKTYWEPVVTPFEDDVNIILQYMATENNLDGIANAHWTRTSYSDGCESIATNPAHILCKLKIKPYKFNSLVILYQLHSKFSALKN